MDLTLGVRSRLILLLLAFPAALQAGELICPRVVVVAMFEMGRDTGDTPGELQFWVEREHLDRVVPLPAGSHDVRINAEGTLAAIVTGSGTSNAAATIMALGCDPRFDLRKTYWLVAGISGINPEVASIGSAAWAEYIVDGELAHEIDAREIPPDWPTGYVPLGARRPYERPAAADVNRRSDHVYHLDPGLVDWAYALTRDTPLIDNAQMRRRRAAYVGYPKAQLPPFVLKGDTLSSSIYWHGRLLNEWAAAWVRFYTEGRGTFATAAMEDSGTLRSLTNLARAGRADVRRVLVLRTGSNYVMQWPGATAAESLGGEKLGVYTAYLPSLEAAYRVGSRVAHALLAGWARCRDRLPSDP